MRALLFLFGLAGVIASTWLIYNSVNNVLVAQENVRIAEQEYAEAKQEYA